MIETSNKPGNDAANSGTPWMIMGLLLVRCNAEVHPFYSSSQD